MTGDPGEALRLVEVEKPDLVLLDLMLPETDGIELMQAIRGAADVPVIFLSAYGRDDLIAQGLRHGGRGLRGQALLADRACGENQGGPAQGGRCPSRRSPTCWATWLLDYAERRVMFAGCPVELMAIEYRMLVELTANAGRVLTYEHLLERVWGERSSGDVRPMRTIVSKLRRKLGDDADNPTYIFTEPRVGYRMPRGKTQGQEEGID